jgi:hypothetical protein
MSTAHPTWAKFWISTVAGLGVLDYVLDRQHNGATLSECTRWLFRTETVLGKSAFTAAMAAGSYVLHQHIVSPIVDAAMDEIEEMRS